MRWSISQIGITYLLKFATINASYEDEIFFSKMLRSYLIWIDWLFVKYDLKFI